MFLQGNEIADCLDEMFKKMFKINQQVDNVNINYNKKSCFSCLVLVEVK
jgi:hypothetical protein